MPRILIIEDDQPTALALQRGLGTLGDIVLAHDGRVGLEKALDESVDLVLTDMVLPELDGMEVISRLLVHRPQLTIIMMTAHSSVAKAVEAMQRGAWKFIEKPIDLERTRAMVRNGLERSALQTENVQLRSLVDKRFDIEGMVGRSASMQELMAKIKRAATSDVSVLIRGPSGVGKEKVAGALHRLSPRGDKPFVAVNCAALSENLLDSELFGHVKGAFTGANENHKGRFERANGGTLFLDEIGDVPLATQVKLLRVLEEGVIEPLGSTQSQKVDVRVITATHVDLDLAKEEGRLREDFYWRIKGLELNVPALKYRVEDISILARHFLEEFAAEEGKDVPTIDVDAARLIVQYDWPGNVRQLRQCMHNLIVLGDSKNITSADLPSEIRQGAASSPRAGTTSLRVVEKEAIEEALRQSRGNKTQAARSLGIGLRTLYRRLEQYGMDGTNRPEGLK